MSRTKLRSWTKDDFDIHWFSGTGAGGQHRNKHQNCLRLTDKETGITVTAQNFRERSSNMKDALRRMADLLVRYHFKDDKERAPVKDVIRTYNEATNRVTDHTSNEKSPYKNYDIGNDIINRKKGIDPKN